MHHKLINSFLGIILILLASMVHAADKPADAAPPAEAAPQAKAPPGKVDIRQVQVKVWISETNEKGIRDIGANLNFTRFVRGAEQSGSVQQVSSNMIDIEDRFGTAVMPYPDTALFGNPLRPDLDNNLADGLETHPGAGMEFSILSTDAGTIDGVFQSLEKRTDVDLISKPELLVANNMPATIKAGGQVPFQDVEYKKGVPELQVNWEDIGVNLALTPTIMPNKFIQLNIEQLEVSDITRIDNLRGVDLPVFSSRQQTGIVFVPDGTTLVIGGLTSRAVRKSERRIPVIGNIPLIGIPFRSRKSDAEITSLLVFVSPTIVDLRAPTEQAESALNFWKERGSEWENRQRIEREVDAMETGY